MTHPRRIDADPDGWPTFFVLGAQRSGTTWLHRVLSAHPGVYVTRSKEPDFLYRKILRQPIADYRDLFRPPECDLAGPRGDLSVNYAMLGDEAVRRVHRLMPDLRLILIIRDPIDRTWSQLNLLSRLMRPDGRDRQRTPLDRASPERLRHLLTDPRFQRRSDYAGQIERWTRVFGRESLLIERYEDIAADPESVVGRILRHIGADDSWTPDDPSLLRTRVYGSGSESMPRLVEYELAKRFEPMLARLGGLFDGNLTAWRDRIESVLSDPPDDRRRLPDLGWRAVAAARNSAYRLYDRRRQARICRRLDDAAQEIAAGGRPGKPATESIPVVAAE